VERTWTTNDMLIWLPLVRYRRSPGWQKNCQQTPRKKNSEEKVNNLNFQQIPRKKNSEEKVDNLNSQKIPRKKTSKEIIYFLHCFENSEKK
jgi:hypothetical protein